jgi:SAM-dependent methyltransferase
MTAPAVPRDIFDRARRAAMRDRMALPGPNGNFLAPIIAESLIDRLAMVQRRFADALLIGAHDADLAAALAGQVDRLALVENAPRRAAREGAVQADEDRLSLDMGPFDLIVWPGGLESVNDVPGALALCRRLLRPDGLLLGTFVGDGSFAALRRLLAQVDRDRAAARMHPQIDVRTAGDLLQRTGWALPVVDAERMVLGYRSVGAMARDLRFCGLGRALAGPVPRLSRADAARLDAAFTHAVDGDGRVEDSLTLVHFSGWAPHPSQPKPAKRGSAGASLAAALKPES